MPYSFSQYLNALRTNENEIPLVDLKTDIFESRNEAEKDAFLKALCGYIRLNLMGPEEIPGFLLNDRDVLIALGYDVWSKTDEQIDAIKEHIRASEFTSDWSFIEALFDADDGSLAISVANESVKELPEFWMESFKKWYNQPREYFLNSNDMEIIYSPLPDKLKKDLNFNKLLVSKMPEFFSALDESLRANESILEIVHEQFFYLLLNRPQLYTTLPSELKSDPVLCAGVLENDGMMLAVMPESCRSNAELAYIAIKQNPKAMECIHDNLTYEVAFIKRTLDECPEALDYSIPRVKYLYNNS